MKTFLRILTIILGISLVPIANADEGRFYVGGSLLKSRPGFELIEGINSLVVDDLDLNAVGITEVPIHTDEGFRGLGGKAFFGIRFGEKQRDALEFTYTDFGTFHSQASAYASAENELGSATGTASRELQADLKGYSLAYIHFFPLGKRWQIFPKAGISYLTTPVSSVQVEDITVTTTSEFGSVTQRESDLELENRDFKAATFLTGVGFTYEIKENWRLRWDFERHGNPIKEPYVDTWSMGFMYSFPKR